MNDRIPPPHTLEILLSLWATTAPTREHKHPACQNAMTWLCDHRLIAGSGDDCVITDKGEAYIERILRTPMPVQTEQWVFEDGWEQ